MTIKSRKYELPVNYDELVPHQKRAVRMQYIREQNNKCCFCGGRLDHLPKEQVRDAEINWKLFPENFKEHPVHLHHNHDTGLTIGAVHMKCNAYLWQYKGE